MTTPHILMVLTSHSELGDTGQPTGFWLEEFTSPYYAFIDGGAKVTLASIQGGHPPIDPKSDQPEAQTDSTQRFLQDPSAQEQLANTLAVTAVNADDYDAIFLPGGHGTMWDFPNNSCLIELIQTLDRQDKIISAVCHAPAALIHVQGASGEPLVKGKSVTAFTNIEETAVALESVVPFMLETRLADLGAQFQGGEAWSAHVETDGKLITGQNPASSEPVAQAVLKSLG